MFITPSILAIITILVILQIAQSFLVNLWGNLDNSNHVFTNDQTYVMHQALMHNDLEKKSVIFVGGSVTREGTLLDKDMEDLHRINGANDEIKFLNLGSSDQSLIESLRLLKTIKINPGSIVYIQFSFKKLNYSYSQHKNDITAQRLPLLNSNGIYKYVPYYDAIIYSLTPNIIHGKTFWNLFIQNKDCSIAGLFDEKSKCYKENPVNRSIYHEANRFTVEQKKAYVKDIENSVYPEFIRNCGFSINFISEIIDYVKSQKAIPVLIEYPISNTEKELYMIARNNSMYKTNYKFLANKALILDLTFHHNFQEEDFFDSQHLLPSGRLKSSTLIINHVAEIINGEMRYHE